MPDLMKHRHGGYWRTQTGRQPLKYCHHHYSWVYQVHDVPRNLRLIVSGLKSISINLFERQKQTTECHYLLYDSTYLITKQPFPISYFCIRITFYSPKRTIYYPSVLAMSPREYYPTCNIIRVASRAGFPSQCNRKLGIPSITNRPQKFSFCFLAILICYFRKDFTAVLGSL